MTAPFHTVHVRVNDAATGQPTPVRIRFVSPSGEYFAPFGRLANFATGRNEDVGGNLFLDGKRYAYIDGSCEVRLPADPVMVEISKGFEYTPQRRQVVMGPGKLALRLAVERWIDLRPERWYSGDSRAHCLSPHAALLEAAAEDLAVVNLLAVQCPIVSLARGGPGADASLRPAIPNILAFSGQRPALEAAGHMVVVNTQNQHPVLGSLGLLNCHRVVYPLTFGGPDGLDDWTLADWCDQCHRKGGLVIWTPRQMPGESCELGGEALADLIQGKVDALEANGFEYPEPWIIREWYTLLNSGLRVPLAGGSGKDSNQQALGSCRTYARLLPGQEWTYQNWIEAVRAGRTVVTNGPLLSLTVEGQEPGTVLDLPGPVRTVHLRAEARSALAFDRLEVVANGAVVARTEAAQTPAQAAIETEVALPAGGWVAARCWGQPGPEDGHSLPAAYAHTSPVYVRVPELPAWINPSAVAILMARLDRMQEWVRREGRFPGPGQREHLAGIFRAARDHLSNRTLAFLG